MTRESFTEFVQDQLQPLARVTMRAMFGGYGLYCGERFFGIVFRGRLYFKTDSASRPAYEARGMRPCRPRATQVLKTYYEVPAEILEDSEELTRWATRAIACRRSFDSSRTLCEARRTRGAPSRTPGNHGHWPWEHGGRDACGIGMSPPRTAEHNGRGGHVGRGNTDHGDARGAP